MISRRMPWSSSACRASYQLSELLCFSIEYGTIWLMLSLSIYFGMYVVCLKTSFKCLVHRDRSHTFHIHHCTWPHVQLFVEAIISSIGCSMIFLCYSQATTFCITISMTDPLSSIKPHRVLKQALFKDYQTHLIFTHHGKNELDIICCERISPISVFPTLSTQCLPHYCLQDKIRQDKTCK